MAPLSPMVADGGPATVPNGWGAMSHRLCYGQVQPGILNADEPWGGREAEQVAGAAVGGGGGGEDGGEAIAPKADDIVGERGEIAEQGVKAVHRERFAIYWLGAFAGGLALRCR